MFRTSSLLFFSFLFLILACDDPDSTSDIKQVPIKNPAKAEKKLSLKVSNFGETNASLFHLTNKNGIELTLTNYGATLVSLKTPDKNGKFADIVLGFNTLEEYEKDSGYLGATIGRYANRIADGKFSIDGTTYRLSQNNGKNSLHGGGKAFDKKTWVFRTIQEKDRVGVSFYRISPDGEEGFPGELKSNVTYTLDNENNLTVEYDAFVLKKPTVINLTNHSYFNLKGEGNGDILDHFLMIPAEKYTPVNENMIPTGIESSYKTPLYFLKPALIGERINEDHPQLKYGNGYDHNYVLGRSTKNIIIAAKVYEPTSGRYLEIMTNQPGIQFSSGNSLNGSIGKSGKPYIKRGGFSIQPQHFPNSPNRPEFPTTLLRPEEKFNSTTVYKFDAFDENPIKGNDGKY